MAVNEEQLQHWLALYFPDQELTLKDMQDIHSHDYSLQLLSTIPGVLHRILMTNSRLVQEVLASFPAPTKNPDDVGITMGFLCPTPAAYEAAFVSEYYPRNIFKSQKEEFATFYWDTEGTEFCESPVEILDTLSPQSDTVARAKVILPTYVEYVGRGVQGIRKLVNEGIPRMLDRDFFLYDMVIGTAYDFSKKHKGILFENVGVGDHIVSYGITGQIYDPSASIGAERLELYWEKADAQAIKERLEALNAQFFRREKKELDAHSLGALRGALGLMPRG